MSKPKTVLTGAQIKALRDGGMSWTKLAQQTGMGLGMLRYRLHVHEAERKPRKWPNVAAFESGALVDGEDESAEDVDDDAPEEQPQASNDEARDTRRAAERERRRASDFEPMKAEDFADEFATGIANDRRPGAKATSSQAAAEKRQEFNERMGQFATDFTDATAATSRGDGSLGDLLPAKHAEYIRVLAEQERRFGNRRFARSLAIAEAHEQLSREAMIHVADRYFSAKVEPTGYAREPKKSDAKRSVCLLLSDLHLGSELDALDEPVTFQATQEARRLEYVLRQLLDYKPQYRAQSEALVILNGDVIEGQLMHDFRSGSPLTEQKAIFWEYFRSFFGYVSQQYPSVRVVCQPGNHGRDKVRHPGRATSRKWDGHEWECYYALRAMCSELRNVSWQLDFRAVSIVNLHGATLGATHGDTEVKLGHPDAAAAKNAAVFDRINSTGLYGVEFDAWVVGHFHTGRYQPRKPRVIYNAMLVPPNGYARSEGHIAEPCGQFLWEAVEGYPIGDLRFVEVGLAQDNDERLGTLIKPFRFQD